MMTTSIPRTRSPMPQLSKIVDYWMDHSREVFPNLNAHIIGWGEPFCFRCGWLAPLKEGNAGPWNDANGWLDRAHLHDAKHGGPDSPDNLVPMCKLCHRIMPQFKDGPEQAIEWVKTEQPTSRPWWWQFATDHHFGHERYQRGLGAGDLANLYLRVNELVSQHARMTDEQKAALEDRFLKLADTAFHSLPSGVEGKAARPVATEGSDTGRVATSSGTASAEPVPVTAGCGAEPSAPSGKAAGIGFPPAVPAALDVAGGIR